MQYPLEEFYKQALNHREPKIELVSVNLEGLNKNSFKMSIPNIPQMDEHTLSTLIKNNIDIISEDILSDDRTYASLFRDLKFINSFIRAIRSIPIDYKTRLCCNKITYDYFTSENPETVIKQQYLNMSKIVNMEMINKLISIGLDENTACNLVLCRYSSSNEKTNVKRLNFAIYHKDPNVMNEQMIIWIYEKLFSRISDLFQATMFEVYTQQQQIDFGENFMEVYGAVGLAVLIILNNMTTENIRKVLIGYNSEWSYLGKPNVRFSLHALSEDYSRISRVVESMSDIYIP